MHQEMSHIGWDVSAYLVDGKSRPLALQQREADEPRWDLRTSFDGKDKMLTWNTHKLLMFQF